MIINTLYHSKRTYLKNRDIKFIVVYYTVGVTLKNGRALSTANYFRTSEVEGSADYVVDEDWYFTNNALKLTAELIRKLMSDYNIPIEKVIMHHHVTGKICPNPFCVNKNRLIEWRKFKNMIKGRIEMVTETNITVNGKNIKANRILQNGKNYIDIRSLENVGFKVGYNADTKLITLDNEVKEMLLNVDGKVL